MFIMPKFKKKKERDSLNGIFMWTCSRACIQT